MPSRFIHVFTKARLPSSLWLNISVSMCMCTRLSLSIHLLMNEHRLFPYLGYCKDSCNEQGAADFFFFDIVILFPSEKYLEVKLLGNMVFYFQFLWVLSILFSIVAAPVYISTNTAKVSPIFSPTRISYLFDTRHSNRYEMMFYCYFDLLFSDG